MSENLDEIYVGVHQGQGKGHGAEQKQQQQQQLGENRQMQPPHQQYFEISEADSSSAHRDGRQQRQKQQHEGVSYVGGGIHPCSPRVALQGQGKSRTTCNFCMKRKKRCDYVEINGQKQQCSLCKSKQIPCIFEAKPQRGGKKNDQTSSPSSSPSVASSSSTPGKSSASNRSPQAGALTLKRARMAPSPATGLVGLEENVFVAEFFDRLGFFPIANLTFIQRAIMEALFKPAEQRSAGGGAKCRLPAQGESMAGVLGGNLAIRRSWEPKEEESRAFSCMLWCTIALGAMTNNIDAREVNAHVRLAEEAIDGLSSEDVPTAKAHVIMAVVYAWLDKKPLFSKHLTLAQQLVQRMEENSEEEEIPMELRDILKELERVLSLHYSGDDVIRRFCYTADGEVPSLNSLMMGDSGLFHMVRYYTDGVFKAFWRDLDARDAMLTETKKFADKHLVDCLNIEKIANRRPSLKNSGGGLYIRAAMQFIRLPLNTSPMDTLKNSIELTKTISKVPGMIRYGPLLHFVHCLVMGLSRPAIAGIDQGAYEKLRKMYNDLDIPGPKIEAAEEMEMTTICKHPFCKGMAWVSQQKAIRMNEAAAAAAAAAEAAAATNNEEGISTGTSGSHESSFGSSHENNFGSSHNGDGSGNPFATGIPVARSPPILARVEGEGNRVEHFPKAAAPGASDYGTGDATGRDGRHGYLRSHDQQPQRNFTLGEATAAAPFEGSGVGSDSVFSMKKEGVHHFPRTGGGGGGGSHGDGGTGSSQMPFGSACGVTWHNKQQQQDPSPRSQGKRTLTALHPNGGPSLSRFLERPRSQHERHRQYQGQEQPWLEGMQGARRMEGGQPPSSTLPSTAATRKNTTAPMEVDQSGLRSLGVASHILAGGQAQARRQDSLERRDNVKGLDELLLRNDDSVPDMYHAESDADADDFNSFVSSSNCGDEGEAEDDSLRTLSQLLM